MAAATVRIDKALKVSSAHVRVEKATSDLLIGPDWTMNMEICDSINSDHGQGKDIVKAVKKRLQHKNPKVQLLALTLLETMIKNCGDYVHFQVAERNILQEMIKIVRKKTDMQVRDKILVLLDSWQKAFGGPRGKYPQYYWAYDELRRSGVEFPQCSADAAPIFTPPLTHPTTRHSLAEYGMPSNSTSTLDEAMASDMESLSLSSLDSVRSVTELLAEMLQAVNPTDREAVKDEVIVDLVNRCRSNQKRLVQLLNSTGDEELLGQGLVLNDSLQTLLAKHDAIASGSPMPTEQVSMSPNASTSPAPVSGTLSAEAIDNSPRERNPAIPLAVTSRQVDEEDEDDDDFAQLARRRSRMGPVTPQSASTETTSNALPLPNPPNPVRTKREEQDIIDLLSITLSTNSTSRHNPLTPSTSFSSLTPPSTSSQAGAGHQVLTSPSGLGYAYDSQPYPVNQGQVAFDSYVVPWAQPQPQPQPQPLPQPWPTPQVPSYSHSYPPPPWAFPANAQYGQSSSSNPYQLPGATHAVSNMSINMSRPQVPSATQASSSHGLVGSRPLPRYNSFGLRGNDVSSTTQASSNPVPLGPRPLRQHNSFGSRGNNAQLAIGEVQASSNTKHVNPSGNKPFVPSYRLFEDLVDLRNVGGGVKTNGTSPANLSGTSSQGMVGGRK